MSAACCVVTPMSSSPRRSRSRASSSSWKGSEIPNAGTSTTRRSTSTTTSSDGSAATASRILPARLVGHGGRDESRTRGVVAEDVAEARADDGAEAVVHQGPDGVLAGGPRAEVRTRNEDRGAGVVGVVQHETRVVPPLSEQPRTESRALDPLQPLARDDLVGVDVRAVERGPPVPTRSARAPSSGSEVRRRREPARNRRRRGDGRRHEVRAASPTLPAFEVAVRG